MNPIIFEQSENPTKLSEPAETERSRAFHLKPSIAPPKSSRLGAKEGHLPPYTIHCLLLLILAFVPPTSQANPPVLVAEDGTFLGVDSANPFDLNSTSNPFGLYGSEYSVTSINNPYNLYGSEYSTESATNPYLVSEPLEK
jgi:hypothetical protein